jgi:hypothetical protein
MLYQYFRPWQEDDFRWNIINRSRALFVERLYSGDKGNPVATRMAKELAEGAPPATVIITNPDPAVPLEMGDRILLTPTTGWRLYELTLLLRRTVFSSWMWPALAMGVLVLSTVVLIGSHGRNVAVFGAWITTISMVGASLVVSLVEYSQPRYSYPMEWVYYVAPLLLALVIAQRSASPAGDLRSIHAFRGEPVA